MMPLMPGVRMDYHAGLPALCVHTSLCRAAISLHGGQLLSFVPDGAQDLLWLSPTTTRPPGALRGGVPVCWPYFGRQGQPANVPQHGHARLSHWQLVDAARETDGSIRVVLALPQRPGDRLLLAQTLRLGRTLEQTLTTVNIGDAPVTFSQALHSYFRVGDAMQASLSGVDGRVYADRYDGGEHRQSGDWTLRDPRDPGRSDRTYADAGGRYALADPALHRTLRIETAGSASLVVWNPGAEGAPADVPADGWRHFVCVEAANAGADTVTLAPKARHELSQQVWVEGA